MANYHSRLAMCSRKDFYWYGPWGHLSQIRACIPYIFLPAHLLLHILGSSFFLLSVCSVCTDSFWYRPDMGRRWLLYHSLPCPGRQGILLSLKPTDSTRCYHQWSPGSCFSPHCLSTGVAMPSQFLFGCWGSRLRSLYFHSRHLAGSCPLLLKPLSLRHLPSCMMARIELRVIYEINKPLPLCCTSNQCTV